MRVSLVQPHRDFPPLHPGGAAPCHLLSAAGARVILGGSADGLAAPLRPTADTLFGPRGVALGGDRGPLVVADTGHHRVLVWRTTPIADGGPADLVLGQRDFAGEARNAGGEVGPLGLNVPTGIALDAGVLAVADAWNHRVLLWHGMPDAAPRPPDVVLGQADFTSGSANRGAALPAADSLNWCYGVAICDGRLIVADTGNRRVLVWDRLPETSGAPADLVLGQRDFGSRDDGGGEPVGAAGMRWPHAVTIAAGALFVADAGTSRVMVWRGLPRRHGAPCDIVLGQADFAATDHNRGGWDPAAATLNMPYGIATLGDRLIVADTANSRLLGFAFADLATGIDADRLTGQQHFSDKGENRWQRPDRDSLCWPYGIAIAGDIVAIADTGNNRVLLWSVR